MEEEEVKFPKLLALMTTSQLCNSYKRDFKTLRFQRKSLFVLESLTPEHLLIVPSKTYFLCHPLCPIKDTFVQEIIVLPDFYLQIIFDITIEFT